MSWQIFPILSLPVICDCAWRWIPLFFNLFLYSQHPLLQQRPGEQADADRGGTGSDHHCPGRDRGGWSKTGRGQRGGGSHLQLLLLPLQPFSGLPLHHDDPHQLVQVSISSRLSWLTPSYRQTVLQHWFFSDSWLIRPNSDYESMQTSMPAVWVKICSSWLGLAIYLWTLVAPLVLPDRDFS